MKFTIETELEDDGRIIAEVTELPGVLQLVAGFVQIWSEPYKRRTQLSTQ